MGRGLHEEVRAGRGGERHAAARAEGVVPRLRGPRARQDAIAHDLIGSGADRTRRRVPALLVAFALVAGLVGYAGNAAAGRSELDALLARVAAAQSQIAYSNRRIAAAVDYTTPLLFRASLQPAVRRSLQQIVQDAAAGQVAGMRHERERVQATRVLPWHRSRMRAKVALARYLDARVAYLRTIAADFQALYAAHPDLDRLLARARAAFLAAAPTRDRPRVVAAFAGGTHPAD